MPKVIRTNPVRDDKGRLVHGRDAERVLSERTQRQLCRVCLGTRCVREKVGSLTFEKECKFCDDEGYAKVVCGDCGEALPMCKCVQRSAFAERVVDPLEREGEVAG